MRSARLVFVFLFISYISKGQGLILMGEVNYGTYKMKSLKESPPNKQNIVPLELVNDYPPFLGFRMIGLKRIDNNLSAGLQLGFNSTGSRWNYTDYSGKVNYDTRVHGISVGLITEFALVSIAEWDVKGNLSVCSILNGVKFTYSVYAPDLVQESISRYNSTNISVQGGLTLNRIYDRLSFVGRIYYEFNEPGELRSSGNGPVTVEWDGIRIGLGIGYIINFEKKRK